MGNFKMAFEHLLFDDFDYIIKMWSKETGKRFLREELPDGSIDYIYDNDSFRRWHHANALRIEREFKLNILLK
jgi:hypothetical protein